MEEQMSLFDMGGLADDGAMRDPVSGNEVPPGSMASEVRDDVPAMLSEGEYIVPADVVRYYGVKFFEDLRMGAKSGMTDMEQDGRIGGEPVGVAAEDDLTPEELQMLAEISGMYTGGMVRKGYQEGGFVNKPFVPTPNYNIPGASLFQPVQPAAPAAPVQTTSATLYGPNGEIVTLTLPTDQERYNALLGQGYSTQQKMQQPVVQDQGQDTGGGGDEEDFVFNVGDSDREPSPLKPEMYEALNADPLAYGQSMLEKQDFSRIAGGLGSLALGPVGGLVSGAVAAGFTANNVAQARAAVEIAKARGLDTTQLENNINSYVASLPNAARVMANLATGENIVERFNTQSGETAVTPTVPTPPRPAPTGGRETVGMTARPTTDPFAGMTTEDLLPPPREDNQDRERTTSWDTGPETARKEAAEKVAKAEGTFRDDGKISRTTSEGKETFASKVARGGGFKEGGLVSKPNRKKPVAKKK